MRPDEKPLVSVSILQVEALYQAAFQNVCIRMKTPRHCVDSNLTLQKKMRGGFREK
jgi:hypothetical protein